MITLENIHNHDLYLLDYITGDIIVGRFKKTFVKGTFKVEVSKSEQSITKIIMGLDECLIKKIDVIFDNKKHIMAAEKYERISDIKYQTEMGYSHMKDVVDVHSSFFLIFTSEFKAKYVAKKIIIPHILKNIEKRSKDLKKQFFDLTDKYSQYEQKLKEL